MEENYGKIVSNIRTAKGVPIGKLISGVCSRTAYRNFVMNQTGTSVDNFMRLLAKLHVSYTEFKYIANGFETDYEQRFVIDLQKAIAQEILNGWMLFYSERLITVRFIKMMRSTVI